MREKLLSKIRLYSEKNVNLTAFVLSFISFFVFLPESFNPLIFLPFLFIVIRGVLQLLIMCTYFTCYNMPRKIEKITEEGITYKVKHYCDGDEKWFYKGKLHREKGKPAIVNSQAGISQFYFNGEQVNKNDTFRLSNQRKLIAF